MSNIWYFIADVFQMLFEMIAFFGNTINYIYIGVIFSFLVVWTLEMIKHRKRNEEHASS